MYSTDDNFMGRDVYGDLERAYLLPHFAAKLAHAQRLLRERRPGWRMLVCDAARPVSVQRYMYSLVEGTPNQVYVADGSRGGRHNYGVAVNATLLDAAGREADMGTPVDFFGERGPIPGARPRWSPRGRSRPWRPATANCSGRSCARPGWFPTAANGGTTRSRCRCPRCANASGCLIFELKGGCLRKKL